MKRKIAVILIRILGPAVLCMSTFLVLDHYFGSKMVIAPPSAPRVEQPSKAERDAAYYAMIERQDANTLAKVRRTGCVGPEEWPKDTIPDQMVLRVGERNYVVRDWTYPVPTEAQAVIALCT